MKRRLLLALFAALGCFAQTPGKGLVIVLIGAPASGKSTQAAFLEKRYEIPVVSVDRMRMAKDAEINADVRKRVTALDTKKGFVLDGYPRTHAQADALAALVKDLKLPAPIIIQLDVPDDVARERAKSQGGDAAANFEYELKQYHAELDLVRQYYPQADIWTIRGTRTPKDVRETIEMLIRDRQ